MRLYIERESLSLCAFYLPIQSWVFLPYYYLLLTHTGAFSTCFDCTWYLIMTFLYMLSATQSAEAQTFEESICCSPRWIEGELQNSAPKNRSVGFNHLPLCILMLACTGITKNYDYLLQELKQRMKDYATSHGKDWWSWNQNSLDLKYSEVKRGGVWYLPSFGVIFLLKN